MGGDYHENCIHEDFRISSISSEDEHWDNSERSLRDIQKVSADFFSNYNDEKKASRTSAQNKASCTPISSAKETEVEEIDDIMDNSIDIIFE